MIKRIQRKPLRSRGRKHSIDEADKKAANLRDVIPVLGSTAGGIVAVLWLAGRSYSAGYFSAMNIPSFQINLSVWEYAEASWQRLFYYFLEKLYTPLTVLASIILAILLTTAVLQRIFPKLRLADAVRRIVDQTRKLWNGYGAVLGFSLGIYLFYLLLLSLIDINSTGQATGRGTVVNSSYLVDVYSSNSLPLEQGQVMPDTSPSLIHYGNLRLLTYNSGRYYLFRELDPATCKPSKVYIIDESPGTYFAISNIKATDIPACGQSAAP